MKKGFTLIELLVVVAIIIVLIFTITGSIKNHRLSLAPEKAYACGDGWFETACDSNSNQIQDIKTNQEKMVTAVPMPQLNNSLERENIAKRAKLFDSREKVSYIYLISYGKVMAFYTVKGKVSSLESYMSPQEQIVNGDGTPCNHQDSSVTCYAVQAPDVDGSYGNNPDGIFFFTTEGAYVEWKGDYMMSDQSLQLSTQPELVREIK